MFTLVIVVVAVAAVFLTYKLLTRNKWRVIYTNNMYTVPLPKWQAKRIARDCHGRIVPADVPLSECISPLNPAQQDQNKHSHISQLQKDIPN